VKSLVCGLLLLLSLGARAEFKAPSLTGPIMDEVGILKPEDRRELEAVIRDYNSLNKAQIQVYVVKSLEGEAIEAASIKITDAWKLGTEKKDNGILFLIAPNDRRIRIEVGQGLEGTLPDAIAKRIVEDSVLPNFKAGDMSTGVVVGVYQIIKYIDQEYADQHLQQPAGEKKSIPGWVILLILFFLLFIGRFMPGRSFGGGGFLGGGFGGGGGGSGWSGGGGGFSGGGASGSW
jgi:uncharacterized protein